MHNIRIASMVIYHTDISYFVHSYTPATPVLHLTFCNPRKFLVLFVVNDETFKTSV